MRTSVQALIALVLVLMVVVGIYAVGSSVFNNAGSTIDDSGQESGNRMDCIFSNPESADSACRSEESNLEVKEENARKV